MSCQPRLQSPHVVLIQSLGSMRGGVMETSRGRLSGSEMGISGAGVEGVSMGKGRSKGGLFSRAIVATVLLMRLLERLRGLEFWGTVVDVSRCCACRWCLQVRCLKLPACYLTSFTQAVGTPESLKPAHVKVKDSYQTILDVCRTFLSKALKFSKRFAS